MTLEIANKAKINPHGKDMENLLAIMARLRDPENGCPWDIEQTFASIAPHTIEEAYEVAEAIEQGSRSALCDELGDLLLQVVFHSQIAYDEGSFSFQDVVAAVTDKMIRRHPHIFGSESVDSAAAQTEAWETLKAQERAAKAGAAKDPSILDGVTTTLPAMTRALKLQNRASRVGFDWTDPADILGKIEEELDEVREEFVKLRALDAESPPAEQDAISQNLQSEIGDLLFTVVNLARKSGIDPEAALRSTNRKFDWRFRQVEQLARQAGRSLDALTLDEMESLWVDAKAIERQLPKNADK